MSKKSDIAAAHLAGGFGCATSVSLVFCEDYGLDAKKAAKLTCGLGGGCASGEVCGAVSGAVMVIGLKYGQEEAGDAETKAVCRAHVTQFIDKFKEQHKALACRDLLDCDTTTEEGFAIYLQKRGTVCVALVKSAVEILEEQGF